MKTSEQVIQELFGACRAKLNDVDAKKVATPIAEAAGKTVVLSLTIGAALSAIWLNAVINAAKEVGEQKAESSPEQSASPATANKANSSSAAASAIDQLAEAAVQSIHLSTIYTLELARVWARNSQTLLNSLLDLLRAR